jgi:hypothetical protein
VFGTDQRARRGWKGCWRTVLPERQPRALQRRRSRQQYEPGGERTRRQRPCWSRIRRTRYLRRALLRQEMRLEGNDKDSS